MAADTIPILCIAKLKSLAAGGVILKYKLKIGNATAPPPSGVKPATADPNTIITAYSQCVSYKAKPGPVKIRYSQVLNTATAHTGQIIILFIYLPLPALRVGGFLAGPDDDLTRAFFSTVAPASDPSTWVLPCFFANARAIVSDIFDISLSFFFASSLASNACQQLISSQHLAPGWVGLFFYFSFCHLFFGAP